MPESLIIDSRIHDSEPGVQKLKYMPKITAVIPAYNEASRIVQTLDKLQPYVDEIIVVDDTSIDNTAELAIETGAKVFSHSYNKRYIDSIKQGFKEASGEIIITLDADGEFLAKEIPRLIKPIIDNQADMVQGHRSSPPRPEAKTKQAHSTWIDPK